MIQDIFPYKFHPEYQPSSIRPGIDYFLCYKKDKVLLKSDTIPHLKDIFHIINTEDLKFLFFIDDIGFYTIEAPLEEFDDFKYTSINIFRKFSPKHLAFAGVTGYHLSIWYASNKYCGACGQKLIHSHTERALICPACSRIIYPNISIAVVVAITNGDEILLSKYPHGLNYALIAGFVETGETLEEACKREVMEEVGLRIKNLKYYGPQPWGFSQTMMIGFFAELDGSNKITLDRNELSEADRKSVV